MESYASFLVIHMEMPFFPLDKILGILNHLNILESHVIWSITYVAFHFSSLYKPISFIIISNG